MELVPILRPGSHFAGLSQVPPNLKEALTDFFLVNQKTPASINLAGLCAYLGTTPAKLNQALEPDSSTPPEARELLENALMHIEAILNEGGLTEGTNPSFTKFILNTYHGRSEKTVNETTTKSVSISFAFTDPNDPAQSAIDITTDPKAEALNQKMLDHIEATAPSTLVDTIRREKTDDDEFTI